MIVVAEINLSTAAWITTMVMMFTLLITVTGILVSIVSRWTRTEERLDSIIEKVDELVQHKNEAHKQLANQISAIADKLWQIQQPRRGR